MKNLIKLISAGVMSFILCTGVSSANDEESTEYLIDSGNIIGVQADISGICHIIFLSRDNTKVEDAITGRWECNNTQKVAGQYIYQTALSALNDGSFVFILFDKKSWEGANKKMKIIGLQKRGINEQKDIILPQSRNLEDFYRY